MKKKLFKWLKVLLIIYIIVGIALYYFQENLLFHPVPLAAGYAYHFPAPFAEATIPYDSATDFNLVQFKLPSDTIVSVNANKHGVGCKGVVLYFHGNRQNINRYAPFAKNFTQNGYDVWMIDYPTFGKSTGKLSEQLLYDEALQFYKLANAQFHSDSIIIYGKSLGTGIAAQLASTQKCKRLILETPYYSLVSMAKHYAWIYPVDYTAKYKIPTNEYFKRITVPITVFHGTADGVVPYSNAAKLKMVMKPVDEFITIENGTHNNLNDFPLFHQKLDSLLR